jgi:hypothetical protein
MESLNIFKDVHQAFGGVWKLTEESFVFGQVYELRSKSLIHFKDTVKSPIGSISRLMEYQSHN